MGGIKARDDAFKLVNKSKRSKPLMKQTLLKRITESFKDKLDLINTG